jgi:hypothetical protein
MPRKASLFVLRSASAAQADTMESAADGSNTCIIFSPDLFINFQTKIVKHFHRHIDLNNRPEFIIIHMLDASNVGFLQIKNHGDGGPLYTNAH